MVSCEDPGQKGDEEMAKELLDLYAKRKTAKGFAFPEDGDWQRDFDPGSPMRRPMTS